MMEQVKKTQTAYGTESSVERKNPCHPIPVSKREMERVIAQPTKHLRKLLFVILVNDNACTPKVSHERLSGMLGVSVSSVKRYIQLLQKAGEIKVVKPKIVYGKCCYTPNQYFVVRKDEDWNGDAQSLYQKWVEVPLRGMWEHVDNAYYAALDQAFTIRELLHYLDADGLDEYKQYLNSTEDAS